MEDAHALKVVSSILSPASECMHHVEIWNVASSGSHHGVADFFISKGAACTRNGKNCTLQVT